VLAVFATPAQATLAMAQLMHEHQSRMKEWPQDACLEVRVGIAGGDVVLVDGDCYGDAVNLAARLCERARPGEIWVEEATVQAAATLAQLSFVRHGTLAMRGKSEPIVVYSLEWSEDEDPESHTRLNNLTSTFGDEPAAPSQQLCIVLNGRRHVFQAQDMPLQIGRAPQSELWVHDPRVSREHARIEWSHGSFTLTDLSRYGTWLRFGEDAPVLLRRESCLLHGQGIFALGVGLAEANAPIIGFHIMDQNAPTESGAVTTTAPGIQTPQSVI